MQGDGGRVGITPLSCRATPEQEVGMPNPEPPSEPLPTEFGAIGKAGLCQGCGRPIPATLGTELEALPVGAMRPCPNPSCLAGYARYSLVVHTPSTSPPTMTDQAQVASVPTITTACGAPKPHPPYEQGV